MQTYKLLYNPDTVWRWHVFLWEWDSHNWARDTVLSRYWPPVSVKLRLTASSGSAGVCAALVCAPPDKPGTGRETQMLKKPQNKHTIYALQKYNSRCATPTLITSTCSSVDLTGSGVRDVLSLAGCTSANARPTGWGFESRGAVSWAWTDGCDTFLRLIRTLVRSLCFANTGGGVGVCFWIILQHNIWKESL